MPLLLGKRLCSQDLWIITQNVCVAISGILINFESGLVSSGPIFFVTIWLIFFFLCRKMLESIWIECMLHIWMQDENYGNLPSPLNIHILIVCTSHYSPNSWMLVGNTHDWAITTKTLIANAWIFSLIHWKLMLCMEIFLWTKIYGSVQSYV